jgi:hypothetical protein
MAFIGNTVQTQGFSPAIDYFNGNGVTVTFTLSRPVASVAQMIVAIDNVIQNPSSAFNVSGNSITFTSAPLSGTNNIWVEYTSLITTYQGISQDPSVIGDITATGGFLSTGDFGNSFIDGAVIDYVTGAGRITVGELDNLIFYHGGTAGRSELMKLSYAGASTLEGGLSTTGSVGVGTASPPSKLSVKQSANSTTGGLQLIRSDNSNYTAIYMGGDDLYFQNTANGGQIFYTNNTERMRIISTGDVCVGTTSASGKVTINQTDTGARTITASSPASYAATAFRSDSSATSGTGWYHLYGSSSGGSVNNIFIYGNGNIQNANNSYGAISDIKLKENIADASPKLAKLMNVKVRTYNLKGEYDQHKQLGVIAQELETIFPSLIEETKDRGENDEVLETTTKSVKYSVFVPMLIKALQELNAKVDAQAIKIQEQQDIIKSLTARIAALEAK